MTVKIIYNDKLIDNAIAAASITSNSTITYSLAKPQDIPKVRAEKGFKGSYF
ncbi:hypothetical protein [Ruminococcus sp.]|uniref:hypothetical protein n=1 Tax=Ruminococcus sp. TaxID=41978 RepID=UPI0025F46059|nr:hypothetical protein [Ruminococcus sp.]